MGVDVPCYISDNYVDDKNVYLSPDMENPRFRFCPGCLKLAPYEVREGKPSFLEFNEEFFMSDYFFQRENTFKKHLLTCFNEFDIQNDEHIFKILTKKQQSIIHRLAKFSQWAQGLDSAMTNQDKFLFRDFSVYVYTYNFQDNERYQKIPVGYISVMLKNNDTQGKIPVIEDIFVFKAFREKGIASKLLDHVIREYNIKTDIGVQLVIAPEFHSILKERFKYVWGFMGFSSKRIDL
jgi:GNAT superfamily N-acetyltransferase